MNYSINNLTAPDAYSGASTLEVGEYADHINIDVSNQPIFWKVKQAMGELDTPGLSTYGAEVFMIPGSRTLDRPRINGFQFRAAVAAASLPAGATPAQVTVEIVT